MATLKDRILGAEDQAFEDVDVSEWDAKVRVRSMSGTDRDAYEAKMVAFRRGGQDVEVQLTNFRSRLLVRVLHDPETDERIFGDGDVGKLGAKSGAVLDRLFDVAQRVSGLDAGAVEAAKGNSAGGQNGGSITG